MRDGDSRSLARHRLAAAVVLACAAGLAQAGSFLLGPPSHAVKVLVSEELGAVHDPEGDTLTMTLHYHPGDSSAGSAAPTRVRVVIRPLAPGLRSRAERLVDRALPVRSEQSPGTPWFVRRTPEGIVVYQLATQEAWTFRGGDGAVVAVDMPGTPVHRTHLAARRYGEHLEVVYQYGREHTDIRALDAFVLAQLRTHVRATPRGAR